MNPFSKMDVQRLRQDFPMLKKTMHGKPLVYLDSAATAQKPSSVIDAITSFYCDHYGTVHRAVYQLAVRSTEDYQKTRQKVRAFLHAAKDEEIIFTREQPNQSIWWRILLARHLSSLEMRFSSAPWSITPILFLGKFYAKIEEPFLK